MGPSDVGWTFRSLALNSPELAQTNHAWQAAVFRRLGCDFEAIDALPSHRSMRRRSVAMSM